MYLEGPMVGFVDRLASGSPEPGGGAASAAVAALGAALVSMVANLTVGKEKYADVQDRITELLDASEKARRELQDLSLIHISEPTRLGMISYAVFCLKKKKKKKNRSKSTDRQY